MRHATIRTLLPATVALAVALLLTLRLTAPAAAAEHLCSDYTYQEDAQANIATYPDALDPDGNGVACEDLPSRMAGEEEAPSDTGGAAVPPRTGVGTTAHRSGGGGLLLIAAGLALIGLGALRQRRRA